MPMPQGMLGRKTALEWNQINLGMQDYRELPLFGETLNFAKALLVSREQSLIKRICVHLARNSSSGWRLI